MTKKYLQQVGSAHVVIIVILIIALVGVLGFLFWQNFMNTQKTNESIDTAQQSNMSDVEVGEASLRQLAISELGVAIQYSDDLPMISYDIEATDMDTQYANLRSDLLMSNTCVEDKGSIAQVIKNPPDVENQTGFVDEITIGENVYGLMLSGTNCAGDTDLLDRFQDSLEANFKDASHIE